MARQVVNDVVLKSSKRAQADSLGNLDAMTALLTKCVELQSKPQEGQLTKQQRRTAQLVVRCVDGFQAQREKDLNGKKKPKISADSDAEERI